MNKGKGDKRKGDYGRIGCWEDDAAGKAGERRPGDTVGCPILSTLTGSSLTTLLDALYYFALQRFVWCIRAPGVSC
jgi:hypothetical protein